MTFADWLFQQLEREDYVGDLARRVEGDDLFPESGSREIYEGYFETFDAEVQSQFDRVWDAWEAEA
jgi:hypothetical protein